MNRDDQSIETVLASLNETPARISAQHIHSLLAGVKYSTHLVPGTTTILATAIMPSGFVLATVSSACAVEQEFNLQMGIEIAINKAKGAAIAALQQLETYRLKQTMHEIRQEAGQTAIDRMRATVSPAKPASGCGHLDDSPSACDCPGGLCSHAIDMIGCR
jgi:hypothetical protein